MATPMSLLKKKPAAAAASTPAPETATPEPEPDVETGTAETDTADEVEIDIDTLDSKGCDLLIAESEITIPDTWKKMKVAEKRAFLNAHFADDTETVAETPVEEAPAPKAAAKGKTKEPAAKPKATDDLIAVTAKELENLNEGHAREMVKALSGDAEFTFFKLGGVLSVIQTNKWFEPYATFREFVEGEHGLEYRRATYYVRIYNELVASDVAWDDVKHLGWTKLKEITGVLTTKNVKQIVKMAEKQTVLQLIDTIKSMKKKADGKELSGEQDNVPASTVTTKTFKVHDDQKKTIEAAIEKAKGEAKTTVDTVALEAICLDYLSGTGGAKDVSAMLGAMTLDDALAAFEKAFPQAELTVTLPDDEAEAA